jgi:hypothetical protein
MTSTNEVRPERVAETVIAKLAMASSEISAYWMAVAGDRERYAAGIRSAVAGEPIVVFIVREIGFNNPNSIASDVIRAMELNRAASEAALCWQGSELHCAIILLGRAPLGVAQASSPVTLPEWSPIRPGETVTIVIEDLTWTVDAPLKGAEARIDEICEDLYMLEGALIRRLRSIHQADHGAGNALLELIRSDPTEKYNLLLTAFEHAHASVSVPSGFRPSLRTSNSLVARLWSVVQGRKPEALHGPSKALASALGLQNLGEMLRQNTWEGFVAVLSRPSSRDSSESERFARGLLMTLSACCQFVTAAAHSDEYARYPVPLLISFSYDVRRSLSTAEATLRLM